MIKFENCMLVFSRYFQIEINISEMTSYSFSIPFAPKISQEKNRCSFILEVHHQYS